MVAAARKARLVTPKIMPGVHLGNHQGNGGPVMDAMEGNLPNAHGDILEIVLQQIAVGV
jgi:hypothetical protein